MHSLKSILSFTSIADVFGAASYLSPSALAITSISHFSVRFSSKKSQNLGEPTIVRNLKPSKKPPTTPDLGFAKHFTDHMYVAEYTNGVWHSVRIVPFENIPMHPAAKVLHYAQETFEGMKAFRGVDGKIRTFRWDQNMSRLTTSADRIAFPKFNHEELEVGLKKLLQVDADWIPPSPAQNLGENVTNGGPLNFYSVYVRPNIIAMDDTLGVSPASHVWLYCIMSPSGPYFSSGMKPVSLYADPHFVRAWPGGTGNYKLGLNYAPTMFVQKVAEKRKCQQVLWLHTKDGEHYLTEVGTMNLFVYWINESGEKELCTPPLNGLILPGVTRKSILQLAQKWNEFKVVQKEITMRQLLRASNENRLIEIFGAGTAAVVLPVANILYQSQEIKLKPVEKSLTLRILRQVTDIQYGLEPHEWAPVLDVDTEAASETIPRKSARSEKKILNVYKPFGLGVELPSSSPSPSLTIAMPLHSQAQPLPPAPSAPATVLAAQTAATLSSSVV